MFLSSNLFYLVNFFIPLQCYLIQIKRKEPSWNFGSIFVFIER